MPIEYIYRCGICNEIIKKIVYMVSIYEQQVTVTPIKENDFTAIVEHNRKKLKSTKTYMVCENCNAVWQHLLNLRVDDLIKLKKDFIGYMKKNKGDTDGNK